MWIILIGIGLIIFSTTIQNCIFKTLIVMIAMILAYIAGSLAVL